MMEEAFERLIDTMGLPLSHKAVRQVLRQFSQECGFEHFAYLNVHGRESYAVASYSSEWQNLYIRKSYLHVDPVITQAKRGLYLYDWSADDIGKGADKDIAGFFDDAMKFGIRSGISMAVPTGFGHQAILTLSTGKKKFLEISSVDPTLAAVAVTLLHKAMSHHDTDISLIKEIGLTPKETTCLRWLSEGKSMQEIADLLGIGFRSVRTHIDDAKRKLTVSTSNQAIAIACRLKLI
jgi:Response regulator containing a CheY-like receiver domain and an HTH DNA-binding domain